LTKTVDGLEGLMLARGARKKSVEVVFTSYVRNEGRVTVPKELRDGYGIKVGDLVECIIRKVI
jgi:hypothetical protein